MPSDCNHGLFWGGGGKEETWACKKAACLALAAMGIFGQLCQLFDTGPYRVQSLKALFRHDRIAREESLHMSIVHWVYFSFSNMPRSNEHGLQWLYICPQKML